MADEKLIEIERTLAQFQARRQLLAARQAKRCRAEDTRRKILAGAVVLEEARQIPDVAAWLHGVLNRKLSRPNDRRMFHLQGDPPVTTYED